MRSLVEDTFDVPVTVADVPGHGQRLLPETCLAPEREP